MTDKLGVAETATTEATRVVGEAQREKWNILVQMPKAVDGRLQQNLRSYKAERAWLKYLAF